MATGINFLVIYQEKSCSPGNSFSLNSTIQILLRAN